jgi:hypothetical protein
MESDANSGIVSSDKGLADSTTPPPLMSPEPQNQVTPPLLADASPPPLPPGNVPLAAKPSGFRSSVSFFLSLCVALFLADALLSLADDSLLLFLNSHTLTPLRWMAGLLTLLCTLLTYGLIGLTPLIPKRWFVPIALFIPVATLATVPFFIYYHDRLDRIAWVMSWCQVLFGLGILYWIQRGFRLRWPLVPEAQLGERRFTWRNLVGFVLVNAFVAAPAVIVYLFFWTALAANRFSEGFISLRPGGLNVQVRNYVRDDGKTIKLVPMSHIGEPAFYRDLASSFPTNALILMEGVSDDQNLLTNKISYRRMAKSLGLSEQKREFRPNPGRLVRADVDVGQFGTNTIDLLNLAMLFHSKGLTPENLTQWLSYAPPADFEAQAFRDLLEKRNERLLKEVQARLPEADYLVVPWGAAHMPGIARGVTAAGFRLADTREYQAIRFWSGSKGTPGTGSSSRPGAGN